MSDVPELLLEGLAEGLILRTVERQPTDQAGLVRRLDRMLGVRPQPERVEPVVETLERSDRIRADGQGVYRLTQEGARRLAAYRGLPDPLHRTLGSLFRIGASADRGPEPEPSWSMVDPQDAWVPQLLARLPDEARIRARFARVTMDVDESRKGWTLSVERHEPGSYEDAQRCPLTFLYEAARRLVMQPGIPSAGGQPVEGSQLSDRSDPGPSRWSRRVEPPRRR